MMAGKMHRTTPQPYTDRFVLCAYRLQLEYKPNCAFAARTEGDVTAVQLAQEIGT